MVTITKHSKIQIITVNGERREVRQTKTARIYSRSKSFAELERLLMDPPDHESPDDLRDLNERIGH